MTKPKPKPKPRSPFNEELRSLLNRHCMENSSDTPDYILAQYLVDCLNAFTRAVIIRADWYARDLAALRDLREKAGERSS